MPHIFSELPLDTNETVKELAEIIVRGMLRLKSTQQIDITSDISKKELAVSVHLRTTERDEKHV